MEITSKEWLEQEDVQSYIKNASASEGEWIKAYESRNSYVEHLYSILLPVRILRARESMKEPSWGDDFDYTNGKIAEVRIRHTHYLGLRFRKFLELQLGTNGYFSNQKGTTDLIARREVQKSDTETSDTIFVRREAVLNFVQDTKQVLQWCVRSQRYSEQHLEELGLEAKSDWRKADRYHYVFERMNLNEHQRVERPRMAAMIQVLGKGIVKLTDER